MSRSKDAEQSPGPAAPLSAHDSSDDSGGYAETVAISGELSLPKSGAGLPRLPDGEVVAGRYRIVRYLARGGMGEVYEAEDQELHERIALKTIRDEVRDALVEERFKREIQLSRKVTHPNVCRIFDVGFHQRPSGERVVFLTMELLAGETLLERVRHGGPMSLDEAMGVVRQICAGLSAAHAVSVVHRDLKSANVMLVPRAAGGVRAVVTDFGLAHMTGNSDERGRSLSGSGGIVGTPGYMAPEQVEGGELTGRTDVYSLGVVMYEMVTGKLPFEGATPLSIAAKRLTMAPPSPRKLRPELPARWERATLACLQRDPGARPPTPRAVVELLDEELERTSLRIAKLNRRAPLVRPLLALLMIAVAAFVTLKLVRGRRGALAAALRTRGLVLGSFDSADPVRDGGHAVAARHAVRTDLLFELPIVETRMELGLAGDQVVRLGVELPRPSEDPPLRMDGRLDVAAPGPERAVELTLRLIDPVTNEQRALIVEHGDLRHLEEAILRAGDRLRVTLDLPTPKAVPLSEEGRRTLEAARVSIRRGELAEAVERIEAGLQSDPRSVELRFLLARALAGLRVDVSSAVATRRTIALGPPSDPFWQERVRALALRRDATLSAAVIEALAHAHPEDLDLQLDLALVLAQAQRHDDALRMLTALAAGSYSPEQQVRIELTALTLHARREDYAPVMRDYQPLRAKAEALGLPGLAFDAQFLGCSAATGQSVAAAMVVACSGLDREARRLRRFDGVVQHAMAATTASIEQQQPGIAALELSRRGYDLASRLGGRRLLSDALNNLAVATADSSSTPWPLFEESLAVARDVHDHANVSIVRQNMAYYAGEEGRVLEQARYLRESMEQARDSESPQTIAFISCQLGHAQARLGDLAGARRSLDEGLAALAQGKDAWAKFSCAMLTATLESEAGNFAFVHAALASISRAGAESQISVERRFDASYRACEAWRSEGRRREAYDCVVALEAGKQSAATEVNRLQTEIFRRLAALELGRGGTTRADLEPLWTRALAIKSNGTRLWFELDLFALDRLVGVPAEDLLPRIDRYTAKMAAQHYELAELNGIAERLRVLARDRSPRLADEVASFVARATRQGFSLLARDAAGLRTGPGR